MSYTKTTWATGDVVTSTKLNNIENGIVAQQALIITLDTSGDQPKFNTKAGVVWEAISNGANVYVDMNGFLSPILTAGYWEDDGYEFDMVYWQTTTLKKAMYLAATADDYPEIPMT